MNNNIKPPKNREEYDKASLNLKLVYAPETYSCRKCSWPVIKGYCCDYCGTTNPRDGKAKWFEGDY